MMMVMMDAWPPKRRLHSPLLHDARQAASLTTANHRENLKSELVTVLYLAKSAQREASYCAVSLTKHKLLQR
jgi:hypothetical protein